jgi:hypothetical protein
MLPFCGPVQSRPKPYRSRRHAHLFAIEVPFHQIETPVRFAKVSFAGASQTFRLTEKLW